MKTISAQTTSGRFVIFITPRTMFKSIFIFALCSLWVVGCGVQGGRFVTTGSKSNTLSPSVGCINIITGYEKNPDNGEEIQNEQNLLYVLIIVPGVREYGSNISYDYGKFVTTLSHSWNTDSGTFSVLIPWNRQTDTVTIGKQIFTRNKGNVFVVRLSSDGQMTGQQLATLGTHSNFTEVLNYVHTQMPTEAIFSSLKLAK